MLRTDEYVAQRLGKLERLREHGVDPYPCSYQRTHTIAEALAQFDRLAGQTVRLAGRIIGGIRRMGRVTFCHIADGTGRIQLFLRQDVLGPEQYAEILEVIDIGDIVGAAGPLVTTRTGERSVEVHALTMLAKALRPLPEKWHGLTDVETRYRQRYLDLIANAEVYQTFLKRSAIVREIRRFLDDRGFIEVETPVLQPLYGGALARPFETYHNALDRKLYLRIATELYLKRLIVGGFEKVYEIGRVFRNEGISTEHNPEFTLLESYEAYTDYQGVMAMTEDLVATVARRVLGTTVITYQGQTIDLAPPWRRITLREAIQAHTGLDIDAYPEREALLARATDLGVRVAPHAPRGKIIEALLETFVQPHLITPTFVLDYPVDISPLAKRKPGRPDLVERFEAYAAGLEIANGYSELNDPLDQRQRFLQQLEERAHGDEEAHALDEDFLTALEYGMPPTGGLGIGIDRLVMVLTDKPSIREVILFPQLRSRE
jgi:lysyl-tRNA synthetase class 2